MPLRNQSRYDRRFDRVRARERFLYEQQPGNNDSRARARLRQQSKPQYEEDDSFSANKIKATLYTLILAGSIIFIAQTAGNHTNTRQSPRLDLSLAESGSITTPEPAIAAAIDKPQEVHLPPTADCKRVTGDKKDLCEEDLKMAETAWRYFENNFNQSTGLVNSIDNNPSTTMWDTGSSLGAFIAARDFDLISQYDFDQAVMRLLDSLGNMELFDNVAPNVLYNTTTAAMVDYANDEVEQGLGISSLDLSRLAFWLNTTQCMHPKYYGPVNGVLSRWDYDHLIKNGQLYGMTRQDNGDGQGIPVQQGRLGYEQYAAKIFETLGFNVGTSSTYQNKFRTNTEILGIPIAHDKRDPREFGVNNFVVTDSYTLDAMELGLDEENSPLLDNIYQLQKKRWAETGITTAVSDDNIDREPYYLYNALFSAGLTFTTTTDTGLSYDTLKTASTKSAISMAFLFPDDEYSQVLLSTVESAYDPDRGWYSGVYENGGFNDVITAHTNGVILTTLLHKKYGALLPHCNAFARQINLNTSLTAASGLE